MKKVAFVGQAMPRVKRDPHDWQSLNKWLYSLGITDKQIKDNFLYTALVDYFPGSKGSSHRVPSAKEIEKESSRLKKDLITFEPQMVVPVGKLPIGECLDRSIDRLSDVIGQKYMMDPYQMLSREVVVIPLPHPSGASTWRYQNDNQKLLDKALSILKVELKL